MRDMANSGNLWRYKKGAKMSNETQGYPDLDLFDVALGQAFWGWVECYKDETGETAAQWVLLKASRQLWPAAFGVVESDTLTAVGIDRVRAWKHIDSPIVAPTLITATYQHGAYRTQRRYRQA